MTMPRTRILLVAVLSLGIAAVSVLMLERQRAGLAVERLAVGATPVMLWRDDSAARVPLVLVAHGYGGSRQMMQAISIMLARAGYVAAAFDFHGHGRHTEPMDADVTTLDGATAQLVGQTVDLAEALSQRSDIAGPVALVGHSMATDIVIRAAAELSDVSGVVAISMYSDAVTADFPERLLIVSGAFEDRLRAVALDRLRQVDPAAQEGQTVRADGVVRRAVSAPYVGHVGVLYSPVTLAEIRDWLGGGAEGAAVPGRTGPWILALLAAILALAWPIAAALGDPRPPPSRLPRRDTLIAASLPVPFALASAVAMPGGVLGMSAFAGLGAFFGVWSVVQVALLWRAGLRPERPRIAGTALLLAWGLGLFALVLDRYGAAFLPVGPRLEIMAFLLVGTVPFCLADAALARVTGWPIRLAARAACLAALLGAMMLSPRLGIAFTVLPVLVLFWVVYGLAGRWVAARAGAMSAGLGLGVILAWAIAASTPLVAA